MLKSPVETVWVKYFIKFIFNTKDGFHLVNHQRVQGDIWDNTFFSFQSGKFSNILFQSFYSLSCRRFFCAGRGVENIVDINFWKKKIKCVRYILPGRQIYG